MRHYLRCGSLRVKAAYLCNLCMGEVHTPLGIGFVCPLATTRSFVFVAALARAAAANQYDKTFPFDSLVRERVRVLSQQNKYIRIALNSAAVAAPARPARTLQAADSDILLPF